MVEEPTTSAVVKDTSPDGKTSYNMKMPMILSNKTPSFSRPWKYTQATRKDRDFTTVYMGKYEKHRSDPDYVSKFHESVQGMIFHYRKAVLNIYSDLILGGSVSLTPTTAKKENSSYFNTPKKRQHTLELNDSLNRQCKWANKALHGLQAGLATYNTFAVDMLNTDYLMEYVPGCYDEEIAYFLHMISNCNTFTVTSKPIGGREGLVIGYDIVVNFDDDIQGHIFGANMNFYELSSP